VAEAEEKNKLSNAEGKDNEDAENEVLHGVIEVLLGGLGSQI
jgi:hypothetical protein